MRMMSGPRFAAAFVVWQRVIAVVGRKVPDLKGRRPLPRGQLRMMTGVPTGA
jgi:hypothetical protein